MKEVVVKYFVFTDVLSCLNVWKTQLWHHRLPAAASGEFNPTELERRTYRKSFWIQEVDLLFVSCYQLVAPNAEAFFILY